jgi:hypothetical protein
MVLFAGAWALVDAAMPVSIAAVKTTALPSLKIWREPLARNHDFCGAFIKTPLCEFENGTVGVYQSPAGRTAWGTERTWSGKLNLEFFTLAIARP